MGEFRLELANSCGNCHADLSSRYALSMHGELTRQGYVSAANCADCHGSHNILPVHDPNSQLAAGASRLRTCQKCHLHAVSNFTDFDPHANFKDAARYPNLHSVYIAIKYTINIFFAGFLIHAFFWFVRALVQRLQQGGHVTLAANQYALPRFGTVQRASYAALMVAFFGLTATGLALKYSSQPWGRSWARILGGFRSASDWHHLFAVLAIVTVVINIARGLSRIGRLRRDRSWKTILLGPDSLVPTGRDLRDLARMLLWFIGVGQKPGFERWAYWEKLDFWACSLAGGLIGFSGLMLWYPSLFCVLLPGGILNVAKVVHTEFAVYLASFLFLIHYFHAHFRPEKFPMDLSLLTGLVSESHLRKYRPDYVARLEREGRLNELRQLAPSRRILGLKIVGGLLVFTSGLCLLAITLLASLSE
jgi:cytochrome b subunit of formate dehydrogenase